MDSAPPLSDEDIAALGRRVRRAERRAHLAKSRPLGRCENNFWKSLDRNLRDRILRGVELYDRRHLDQAKAQGRRCGPIGLIGIQVYRLMVLKIMNYSTGRLEPSISYIAKRLGHSRQSIVNALKALRAHGFLDWLRRYEIYDDATGEGKIRQATNAYRVMLPREAEKLIAKAAPPVPDDFEAAKAEKAKQWREMDQAALLDELRQKGIVRTRRL